MKKIIKKTIDIILNLIVKFTFKFRFFRYLIYNFVKKSINEKKTIDRNGTKLEFYIPNELIYFRISTFSSKEPETLNWIDKFKEKSVFYDIGANIGLYTCYAAKKKDCNTFAFEPSVFNLENLAKNIHLNNLSSSVKIIPLSLTSKIGIDNFNLSNMEWGGALSTFGKDYTLGGSAINKKFKYKTLALSLNDCVKIFNLPKADYVKIDVDGIEHLILEGGEEILKNAKSILVEIDDRFEEQKLKATSILKNNKFKLIEKTHSKMFENSESSHCFNQIWNKV